MKNRNIDKRITEKLLDDLIEGIIILKADPLRIIYTNDYIEQIIGYKADELIGKNSEEIIEIFFPENREFHLKRIEDSISNKQAPQRYEFKCKAKDGSVRWLYASSNLIIYENEPAIMMILVDITQKKATEELIYNKLKKFKEISENQADWVWEIDQNLRFTFSSLGIKDILGYNPEEILGNTLFDFMTQEEAPVKYKEFMEYYRQAVTIRNFDSYCIDSHGKKVLIETNAVPFFNGDNQLMGYRGVSRDISSRQNQLFGQMGLNKNKHNSEKQYKVLIAEDHNLTAKLLKVMLLNSMIVDVVGVVTSGLDLFEKLLEQKAEILLLDLVMPEFDGIHSIEKICEQFPRLKIIILSAHTEAWLIQKALSSGALGYLTKYADSDEVIEAIKTVSQGRNYLCKTTLNSITNNFITNLAPDSKFIKVNINKNLTVREQEILDLIAKEYTTPEIAKMLAISTRTAETHRKNILKKLGTKTTAGLIKIAMETGLLKI
jgi:PAS domain S-box-containing protein